MQEMKLVQFGLRNLIKKAKHKFVYFVLLLFTSVISCHKSQIYNINYADAINIIDFGAIPNDNKDDSKAIQTAIDFAIKDRKSSLVYCPAGVYDLEQGVVIANQKKDGEYQFVTLTLTGPIATYSGNQHVGKTAVFNIKHKGFGVALQLARQCVVQNIVFQGSAKFSRKAEDILKQSPTELFKNKSVSINRFSPSCAIAIDPFHFKVPYESRYNLTKDYYRNNGMGGTSMVLIKGCSFHNHYIGIANNSSGRLANGDNIKLSDANVNNVHTFWSAGQTQSRDNHIENVYAKHVHTFVSGMQIGALNGTPPMLKNVSVAGFCKQIIEINTGFSGFSAYQSYFESLYHIGLANCKFISFNQCQLKFKPPASSGLYQPSYHLKSNAIASFNDCDIAYFSNCTYKPPFTFYAAHVNMSGGQVEGGMILPSGITNAGGENLHNITFNNTGFKCYKMIISEEYKGEHPSNIYYKPYVGGCYISLNDKKMYKLRGSTYELNFLSQELVKEENGRIFFETSDPSLYQNGDVLVGVSNKLNSSKTRLRLALGVVDDITGNRVYLSGCPKEALELTHKIYVIDFIWLTPKLEFTATKGKTSIELKQIIPPIMSGRSIESKAFAQGTRIIGIDGKTIYLNKSMIKTGKYFTNDYLINIESNSKL